MSLSVRRVAGVHRHATICVLVGAWIVPCAAEEPPASVKAPAVVVTATRTAQSVIDVPGAISVIPKAEIERLNAFTLDQAVGALPGLFSRRSKSFMDTQGSIQLRGIPDDNRTLILVDGLPMNDGYTGGVRLGSLSLADVSRVEVLRGPGSSLYGGNAMGGVVQVLTRMPDGPLAEVRAGYGNALASDFGLENLRTTTVRLGNRYDSGLSILATYAQRTTDGYRSDIVTSTATPPGTISGAVPSITSSGAATRIMGERGSNAWEDYDAGLSLRYDVNAEHAFQLRLRRVYYQYSYGEPLTYLRNAAGNPVFNFTNGASVLRPSAFTAGGGLNQRDILQGVYEGRLAGGELRLQLGYIDSGQNRFATADSTLATPAGGPGRITNTPNTTELIDGQWTRGVTAAHTITLGASLRRDSAHVYDFAMPDWRNLDVTSGSILSESRGKSLTTSLFGQDQWAITNDLTAYLGLRWDRWQATDGFAQDLNPTTLVPRPGFPRTFADRSDSALSPKAGLVWQADEKTTLRTSLGTAFRAPAMFDMHRTFVSTAGTIFLANPDLDPETIRSFDAGIEHRPWEGGRVAVNVFHNDLRDLLYRRTVTVLSEAQSLCGTSATITNCRQLVNAGRARSRGIEIELAHASGPWQWFANAMYVDSRVLENAFAPASIGRRLVGVPQLVANGGATYSTGGVSVTAVARYAGKVFRDDSNGDRFSGVYGSQDARTLVDVKAAWRLHKHAAVSLAIDNLFDRQYFDFFRGVGRTAFAELTLNY
jgi:iron complex outermembrane receptor protein